jgi:hypothetical protein
MQEQINGCHEFSLMKAQCPLWPRLSLADKVLCGLMFTVALLITILILLWADRLSFLAATLVHGVAVSGTAYLAARLFGNSDTRGDLCIEALATEGSLEQDQGDCLAECGECCHGNESCW